MNSHYREILNKYYYISTLNLLLKPMSINIDEGILDCEICDRVNHIVMFITSYIINNGKLHGGNKIVLNDGINLFYLNDHTMVISEYIGIKNDKHQIDLMFKTM